MTTQGSIPVVAAVVEREGRFLVGRRPIEKRHGGLWEFPGGKVDDGESMAAAVRRELDEELGLRVVQVGDPIFSEQDEGSRFEIHFVRTSVEGEPIAREHSEVGWFTADELIDLPLAPSDLSFARSLRSAQAT